MIAPIAATRRPAPAEAPPARDDDSRAPAFRDTLRETRTDSHDDEPHRDARPAVPRPAAKRRAAGTTAAPDPTAVAAAPAPDLDRSPVAALVAATVSRALAAFGRAPVAATAGAPAAADAPAVAAPQPPAPPAIDVAAALSPLEQAVADLIEKTAPRELAPDAEPETEAPPIAVADATPLIHAPLHAPEPADRPATVAAPAPIREIAAPPEPAANPSHVHLVLDDPQGGERIVVTVAVRGEQVNVAVRGGDDGTAAALARNAASLDHALRARGLDLTDFTATRDHDGDRPAHDHREPPPAPETEPFVLEEIA